MLYNFWYCRWCLASHLLIQLVYQYDSSEPTISFLRNTIKHSLAGSCSSVDPSCFTWQNLPPSPSRGLQLAFGQSFTNSAGSSVWHFWIFSLNSGVYCHIFGQSFTNSAGPSVWYFWIFSLNSGVYCHIQLAGSHWPVELLCYTWQNLPMLPSYINLETLVNFWPVYH